MRSEEHTSELHSFPTRRSSDLFGSRKAATLPPQIRSTKNVIVLVAESRVGTRNTAATIDARRQLVCQATALILLSGIPARMRREFATALPFCRGRPYRCERSEA